MSNTNTLCADPLYKLSRITARAFRWKLDAPPVSGIDPLGFSEKHYAEAVSVFIATTKIKAVVELGCGDFRVGRMIARSGVGYTGVDGEESVIARNRELYQKRKVRFYARDVIRDELPDGDLCLAGELFHYLTNDEIHLLLLKLKKYKYVIFMDYQPRAGTFAPNLDKPPGQATRLAHNSALDLRKPPFNLNYVAFFTTLLPDNPVDNRAERLCCFLIPMHDQATYLDPVYMD
jgi:SAM-dependent methyltransferase